MKHFYLTILLCCFVTLIFGQAKPNLEPNIVGYYRYTLFGVEQLNSIDSADYYTVVTPPDPSEPELYNVTSFFKDGKVKFRGKSLPLLLKNTKYPQTVLQNSCIEFYPEGKRRSVVYYNRGHREGINMIFYPSGKPYAVTQYSARHQRIPLLVDCYDAQGNPMAHNGNGHWMICNSDMKQILMEGMVKDSLMEGDWKGITGDDAALSYIYHYKAGKLISAESHDEAGHRYSFTRALQDYNYTGGINELLKLSHQKLRIGSKQQKYAKPVLAAFIIDAEAKLTDIELMGDDSTNVELRDAVAGLLMPTQQKWIPIKYYGKPIRTRIFMILNNREDYTTLYLKSIIWGYSLMGSAIDMITI